MATSLVEQRHFLQSLIESDRKIRDAIDTRFLLIQSLLKKITEQIEQQQEQVCIGDDKETP
jgi:hypothetical protein